MAKNITTLRVLIAEGECWDVSTFEQLQTVSTKFLKRFIDEEKIQEPFLEDGSYLVAENRRVAAETWVGMSETEKETQISNNKFINEMRQRSLVAHAMNVARYDRVLNTVLGESAFKTFDNKESSEYYASNERVLAYHLISSPENLNYSRVATPKEREKVSVETPVTDNDFVVVLTPFEVWLELGKIVSQPMIMKVQR